MPQIMKVEPPHAGLLDSGSLGRLEVRPARDRTLGADEHTAVGSRLRPPLDVCAQALAVAFGMELPDHVAQLLALVVAVGVEEARVKVDRTGTLLVPHENVDPCARVIPCRLSPQAIPARCSPDSLLRSSDC
jgi:hypothetical protein